MASATPTKLAFKLASNSRHPTAAKPIYAFDDGDDEDEQDTSTIPEQEQQAAGPGPSSSAAAAAAWVEKGSAAAERGDSGAALCCWDQALLLQPEDGRVHEMRAQVLNAEGRTYEAIQAAQQVGASMCWAPLGEQTPPLTGPSLLFDAPSGNC